MLVTCGMCNISGHSSIALYQAGIRQIFFDNLANASIKVLNQLKKITGCAVEFIRGSRSDALAPELVSPQAKAVLHFRALKTADIPASIEAAALFTVRSRPCDTAVLSVRTLTGLLPRRMNKLQHCSAHIAVGRSSFVYAYSSDNPTSKGARVRDYPPLLDLAKSDVVALLHHQTNKGLHTYSLAKEQNYPALKVLRPFSLSTSQKITCALAQCRTGNVTCDYSSAIETKDVLGGTAERGFHQMTDNSRRWHSNYPQ